MSEGRATATSKRVLVGTHRACSPDETLRRLGPLLPRFGITRLAEVTWLDSIGVPVYQAVRPTARTLSVSQGKGVTRELAKVSAAMEAVELWHAEQAGSVVTAEVGELAPTLDFRLDELSLLPRHHLNDALRIGWSRARGLGDQQPTFVPTDCVRLDATTGTDWAPKVFRASSNGLASGNILPEATLHGLYEVVERDALQRTAQAVDPGTVTGSSAEVLDRFRAARIDVRIEHKTSPTRLPCFRAVIWDEAFPVHFVGAGCHLDADVALSRALTEAAQSRLTTIAGTRDDLGTEEYQLARTVRPRPSWPASRSIPFDEVESIVYGDFADDLRLVVDRVVAHTGRQPLVVDHTRTDLGVPVVTVVCPGLRFQPDAP
ncbi:YcaO-like family protein [Kribbella sp. NPDC002412]